MYYGVVFSRLLTPPANKSFFLFGPRGTGKSSWSQAKFSKGLYIDLLRSDLFNDLMANPERLSSVIPAGFKNWIILDEIQRIPSLLNEVHRLIENKRHKFVLTGSSARKLRKRGVNLLAGRALTYHMHPLTCQEMKKDFNLKQALLYGLLPSVSTEAQPKDYLESYVKTYLQEEVLQEGLTRNMGAFTRFLEAASFSQGSTLNMTDVARECSIERKVVENYFSILEDLMLAIRLPVFSKRAKRKLSQHPKFYFFDVGVFRTLRPMGPLDSEAETDGPALETLFLQHLRALNDSLGLGYQIYFWRTQNGMEVDFVLYGPKGLLAFEIKRSRKAHPKDMSALEAFVSDYPVAKGYFLYGGTQTEYHGKVTVLPFEHALVHLEKILLGQEPVIV